MSHIAIDGCRLEVRTLPGDAAKPWLVFLHEGLGSVSLWRDFPDKLVRRLGCRALIYSRRGYGASDGLAGPRTPSFMHDEARHVLPRLCAAFGIERPLLIGHSDGASIALIRAADAPDDVAGLVLMAPHVFVEPLCVESIARVRTTYETTDLRDRLARHHARVDDAFRGWSDIWLSPAFRDWSLIEDVSRLSRPTLVIQGTDDEYGTRAQVAAIAEAANADVQQVVLDHCGHSPHRDQEGAVLDAIAGFVGRLGISGR
jgi:pimeloyl-ACP methyl ester carboxylesterase